MFLLGCALTEIRLYNTQPHDVTELKCYKIFPDFCYNGSKYFFGFFAKYIPLRKMLGDVVAQGFRNTWAKYVAFRKSILTSRKGWDILVYGHFRGVFAKEYTLRKFLCHFLDRKRTPFGVLFTLSPSEILSPPRPCAYSPWTSGRTAAGWCEHRRAPAVR